MVFCYAMASSSKQIFDRCRSMRAENTANLKSARPGHTSFLVDRQQSVSACRQIFRTVRLKRKRQSSQLCFARVMRISCFRLVCTIFRAPSTGQGSCLRPEHRLPIRQVEEWRHCDGYSAALTAAPGKSTPTKIRMTCSGSLIPKKGSFPVLRLSH